METNTVLDTLFNHSSVRRFTDEPIPPRHLEAAVRAGQQAATSSNVQAYSAVCIRDPEKLERLVECSGGQKKVAECPLFMVICGDTRRHRLLVEKAGHEFVSNLEVFMVATIDASLFAQNMVVAFESMGYGTCYIGGIRNDLNKTQEVLRLPEGVWPLFGLCIGRPARDSDVRPRLDSEAVVFEERYPTDSEMFARMEAYDARLSEWYAAHGLDPVRWTDRMETRFQEAARVGNFDFYRRMGASFH